MHLSPAVVWAAVFLGIVLAAHEATGHIHLAVLHRRHALLFASEIDRRHWVILPAGRGLPAAGWPARRRGVLIVVPATFVVHLGIFI